MNEEEKIQKIRQKFKQMEEKQVGAKKDFDEQKEFMQENRYRKQLNSAKKLDQLNNYKMNYKLLTVKKLMDKSQRGDSVMLQNKIISEAGYSNHKTRLN